MSYKTIPDEDDGFGQLIPLCREYTLSRVNRQSRAFAAILGGTIIGSVIEVQIVKMLDQYGLDVAVPSPNERERTSYVMISRRKSRFVDEFIFPKPNADHVQNYSLNFTNLEDENLAWNSRRPASWKLVQPMLENSTSNKETSADTLSITPSQASLFAQRTKRSWNVLPANSSHGGALPTAVSKKVTRMVRHHDQDERQPDAALHWDTIRTVLLKALDKIRVL